MPGTKSKGAKQFRVGRGRLGGQVLSFQPYPNLRPTLSRVREAVFSIIAEYAATHGFIDGCGGTGVMATEAVSMGFEPVICCETHGPSIKQIEQNWQKLGIKGQLLNQSVLDIPKINLPEQPWVIYMDPPYQHSDLHGMLLDPLASCQAIAKGSIYIAESEDGEPVDPSSSWTTMSRRRYGRTQLWLGLKT